MYSALIPKCLLGQYLKELCKHHELQFIADTNIDSSTLLLDNAKLHTMKFEVFFCINKILLSCQFE